MQKIIRNILILVMIFSLSGAAMAQSRGGKAPQKKEMSAADKKKAAEKKKKEQAKAKAAAEKKKSAAQKQKEADKKKAAAAQKQKEAAKQKETAAQKKVEQQQAAQKEAARQQAAQERAMAKAAKPFEGHNYINLGIRAGYDAQFDHLSKYPNSFSENPFNVATKSLVGGPGAGLQLSYELEYKHFLFETGLALDWYNSMTHYSFQLDRPLLTYPQTYHYLTDDLRETRNLVYANLPIMMGAQFGDFYFLLGARLGYGAMGTFAHKGLYDITVDDADLLKPYGYGIIDAPSATGKLTLNPLACHVAAEVGLDLDKWLQADPDPKKKKVKPGERQKFGKEYIHYRVSLFAEYNVLNGYKFTPADTYPLDFVPTEVLPNGSHTVLGLGGNASKLNNLFVGARFTIQFEIPGKAAVPLPAYAEMTVVDSETGEVLPNVMLNVTNTKTNRVTLRDKVLKTGVLKKTKMQPGEYELMAMKEDYEMASMRFSADSAETTALTIQMRHKPYFYVTVSNAETGSVLPVNVVIRKLNTDIALHTLATDSASGTSRQMLSDSVQYSIHINHIGYEPYEAVVPSISEHMHVQLVPVKKGEVFIMKNMFFATNKTRILPTSEQSLQELSDYLMRNPELRIKIIGHTDNVGKDAANQKLSEGRAQAVRDDLIKRGVAAERLQAEGRGESQPIDTNDTEEGRQNNRRVEIEVF